MTRKQIKGHVALVVGGAGFIGSHLVDSLLKEGAQEVVVVDSLFTGSEKNLVSAIKSGRTVFYREDAEFATNLSYIVQKHQIDMAFNCATKALNYSFINPANAFSTNVNVVLNLLELQRARKFETLCHFSTSEVYGSAIYEPMDESHPKSPTTTYAAGKAAADLAIESYVSMFDNDAFIVRPFNNYGPRQNHEGPLAGLIPLTAKHILNAGAPEIHGVGSQTRDFIYVHDTVNAVVQLFSKIKRGDAVNISSGQEMRVDDVINRIVNKLNYNGDLIKKKERKADVAQHNGDNKKLLELINFQQTNFDDGLEETLKYFIELCGDHR